LETVVEAARLLERKRNGSIQIVLAGDGDKYKKLRNMSRGLRNVIFTGWIDEVSIFALMHISSVGLSPYIKNAFQSLPNKPFEYMAAGLPILSSLQGELEMLIRSEKLGIQYQAGDVSSLVENVLWFLENIEERKAMGVRARKLLEERFSVEKVYGSLAKHLEHVGSERSGLPEAAKFGSIRHD